MKDLHTELIRLHEKIDQVNEKQGEMNATLAAQHVSLKEHMRRTQILEQEMRPVKSHVALMNNAAKVLAVGGAIALFLHKMGLLHPLI